MNKSMRPFGERGWYDIFPRSLHHPFQDFFTPATSGEEGPRFPLQVDVSETPESYVIKAEVPGVDADELDVDLSGDTLTIRGEKRSESTSDDENYHVVERRYGSFQRSFAFPAPVAAEGVTAESKDGVLTSIVRKAPTATSQRISVKSK